MLRFTLFCRKLAAYLGSLGAGVHAVLFAEYDLPGKYAHQDHCFSGIRRSYDRFVHTQVYGLTAEQYQQVLQQQQRERDQRARRFEEEMNKRLR